MAYDRLLTYNAITQMLDGHKPVDPVVQIIGYKPMSPEQVAYGESTNQLRYRLMIGDGQRAHQYCVITNQDLVEDIKSGNLEKWSVVKIGSYQIVDYQGDPPADAKRKLIYILNLDIVKRGSEVGQKIVCSKPSEPTQPQQFDQAFRPHVNNNLNNGNANSATPYQEQAQPFSTGSRPELMHSPRPMRSNSEQVIAINELTPYIGKWAIKGRVTSKSGIREYNNAKGGGKLFSFTLADKSGEIKVTAFNADCERVFAYVEPNKVYLLTRASIRNADKRYSAADLEITLQSDSHLEEVRDANEISQIPMARFNFVSIGSLASTQPAQPIDLIGAITNVGEFSTIVSRTKNKELKKRNITIVDMSRHTISVTIWGDQAESFSGLMDDIFVTKAARVGTYGGRSASAGDCFFINPDIPECRKLKNWYQSLLDKNFTALTQSQESGGSSDQWRYIGDCLDIEKTRELIRLDQQSALYSKTRATIFSVGKNPVYKCCPQEGCGKKLMDTQNGELKCEKCQQTYSNYKYRYKTDIEVGDVSGSCWTTLWDEKAENLFGMKAEELERYMRMENKEEYENIITKPNFKTFLFTTRSRIDTYNQEERVKLNIVNMVADNPLTYSKRLIEEIKQLSTVSM